MASSHSDFAGNPAHPSETTQELADDRVRETRPPGNSADGPRGHEADAGVPSTDARTNAEEAEIEKVSKTIYLGFGDKVQFIDGGKIYSMTVGESIEV